MSIKLMSAIWTHPELSKGSTFQNKTGEEKESANTLRTMKMVLLAFSDMANDEGVCWPSYKTLAEKTNITENYLRRGVIPKLEANDWLKRVERFDIDGRQTSNYFSLNVSKILTPPTHTVRPPLHTQNTPPPITQNRGGGGHTEHSHDPSLETKEETSMPPPPSDSHNQPTPVTHSPNGKPKQAKMTGDRYLDAAANKHNRQLNGQAVYGREAKQLGWNREVPVGERVPIAEAIADLTWKRPLWDAGDERVHDQLHQSAIVAYKMGYTTPESIRCHEADYHNDWRGENGGSPSQLVEFLGEVKQKAEQGKQAKKRKRYVEASEGDM